MIRMKLLVFIILLFISEPVTLAEDDSDFLYGFLNGSYELIGRWPDSNQTYSGKIILEKDHGYFRVVRIIDGNKITGIGKIETATPDKVKVLRIRFKQEGQDYEGTYLPHFKTTQRRIATMGHAEVQKVTPSQAQSLSLAWAHCQTDALSVCALATATTIGWSIRAG